MKNIWVICQKELRSYFVSPIAYILFIIYAAIFWILLLEHGGSVHLLQHGVADARGDVSHERQRPDRAATFREYKRH